MVLLEFSMSPFGKGESLSPYVARSLDIIDKSGVAYQLTPMGTIGGIINQSTRAVLKRLANLIHTPKS
jgi:uncharacterized protein YqgV (UPF0045/DUF77 family)